MADPTGSDVADAQGRELSRSAIAVLDAALSAVSALGLRMGGEK